MTKIVHWSLKNNSGMHRVAESTAEAEVKLGLDSRNIDCSVHSPEWEESLDADVHVVHTHLPEWVRRRAKKGFKVVWVAHGTPDHVFQGSVEVGQASSYGHADPFMLMQHWLKNADARVTFWPRHHWIYSQLVDKGIKVHLIPLGVDKAFWAGGASRGKYQGTPSVLYAENPHWIKWPFDLYLVWPEIAEGIEDAKLHSIYMPRDMHRWVFPLVNRNGTSFHAHISPITFAHEELRNVFKSVDFQVGLVRYGDFNQLSLQANAAAGCKTVSYNGNEYADYWVQEGDQRVIAKELSAILKGEVEPRKKTPVPDISETATAMKSIYEEILS